MNTLSSTWNVKSLLVLGLILGSTSACSINDPQPIADESPQHEVADVGPLKILRFSPDKGEVGRVGISKIKVKAGLRPKTNVGFDWDVERAMIMDGLYDKATGNYRSLGSELDTVTPEFQLELDVNQNQSIIPPEYIPE